MQRRRFLVSLGGLAGATSLALGTTAFTSVSATRSVSVTVADDERAFLRLEPLRVDGSGGLPTGRSKSYGEQVWFSLPGTGPGETTEAEGLGVESVYEFHELLRIENQGTQPVEVYSTYGGETLANLALVRDSGVLRDDPPVLDVGEAVDVGLLVDTHGTPVREMEYNETLTIVADQPDA
ncbi:MAG: hypothetical protein ABEJ88_09330 [Halobacterium sp.]